MISGRGWFNHRRLAAGVEAGQQHGHDSGGEGCGEPGAAVDQRHDDGDEGQRQREVEAEAVRQLRPEQHPGQRLVVLEVPVRPVGRVRGRRPQHGREAEQ